MKNKWTHIITCAAIGVIIASVTFPSYAYASDGEDYITISVDAVDDNTDLQYALDSDEPTAFTKSNEFTVPAGTSHTIYVKDAAGNVTSQRYEPQQSSDYHYYDYGEDDEDTQQINIDLELGRKETEEEYSPDEEGNPGTASVTNRTKTDGSVDAEKVFYTFTTKEGEELYLVVDQGRGSDNVYLLDTVSLGDLRVLADGGESSSSINSNEEKEDNLLSILAAEESADDDLEESETSKKEKTSSSSSGNPLLIFLIVAIGCGAYYYLKIYRTKKDEKMDEMDAMDMDEFEAEEDEEEEIGFDYDDEEKQLFLDSLLNDDDDDSEDLLETDPDDYATSHIEDGAEDEFDVDIF